MHPAALTDDDLLKECELARSRSGGPGGQHRNKVETKVTITHRPTGIEAHAGERRSVQDNKRVALFRLRLALALLVREPVPIGEARSSLWRSRCRDGRIVCSPEHRDYPAMLAEALDMIETCSLDPGTAALRLECTPSQLVKLVKDHPPALEHWNRSRADRGQRRLS